MKSIQSIQVELSVVLGKTSMPIHQLLRMGRGAVIELETQEDDQVQILANNTPIAMADVVIQGDKIGIQITEKLKIDGTAE